MSDVPSVPLEIDISEASLDRMAAKLAAVLERGVETGLSNARADFSRVTNSMQETLDRAARNMGRSLGRVLGQGPAFETMERQMDDVTRAVLRASQAFEAAGRSELERISLTARARERERALEISRRDELVQGEKQRTAIIEQEGKRQAIEAQRVAQLQVVNARAAGKQRVLIVQETLRTIARLERAFGATVAGIARTTTSAISRSFSGLGRLFARNNADIAGVGGLSSSLRTRESLISRSFSNQEKLLRQTATRQSEIITRINTQAARGVTGVVTGRGAGGGLLGPLAVGGGAGLLISAGFQRFSDLERINKQFIALTGSIEKANLLLEQAKEFAKTTPFDLVGVADLVKGFLAIGSSAEEAMKQVRVISDAVAFTGGGNDALTRIQRAIGQVVSAGRLQGDELNQLAENLPGLNIRQILANQLTGGNVRALVEMQEAGELTADKFVTGLITGLGSDPRLVGAAGELSKTLSGRFANLKESFADLGAALIGSVAGPLRTLASTTQTILQGLADFIKGENLSGGLIVLRDALQGVALGMLAVIAAKGAVEVVRLLTLSLSALLTPFGAVLLTAGIVGAAISVFARRSEDLREALVGLGRYIQTQGMRIWEALGEAFNRVVDAFTKTDEAVAATADTLERTAEPAGRRFRDIANRIKEVLFDITTFLTDRVIPAMATAVIFLGQRVGPAIRDAISAVRSGVEAVAHFVDQIAQRIRPALQPAIDGLRTLKLAIQDALGGDFSQLGDGFRAALAGLGTVIESTLGPVVTRVRGFIDNLFSGFTLGGLASNILNVVEEIGRILGSIVSNPIFLKALLGVAAAAALVALRFVEGLARGILANRTKIVELVGDLLRLALEAVVDNLIIFVPLALAAALLGPRLVALFRTGGTQAATAFSGGFVAQLGQRAGQQALLFRSIFDAQAFTKHAEQAAFSAAVAMQREFNRVNLLFRNAGQPASIPKGLGVTEQDLRVQQTRLRALEKAMGPAAFQALELRTRLSSVKDVLLAVGRAAAVEVPRNFSALRAAGGGVFSSLVGAFREAKNQLIGESTDAGIKIGAALGAAVRSTVSAALLGIGGFVAGRAEGQAGGSGLFAAISSGLLAGALTPGPAAIPVGVTVAGLSLIGAAFGRAGADAKKFREETKQAADALRNELIPAAEEGALKLDARGQIDTSGLADLTSTRALFFQQLGEDGEEAFRAIGASFDRDIKPLIERGGDLSTLGDRFKANFVAAATSSREFLALFKGADAEDARKFLTGESTGRDAFGTSLFTQRQFDFLDNLKDTLGDVDRAAGLAQDAVNELGEDIAIGKIKIAPTNDQLATFAGNMFRAGRTVGEVNAALERLGVTYRVDTSGTLTNVTDQFDDLNGVLDEQRTALGKISDQFDDLFGSGQTGFKDQLDSLVLAADSFRQQVADSVSDGVFDLIDQTNFRQGLDRLGSTFGEALRQGISEGVIVDEQTAREALAPFLFVASQGLPAEQQAALRKSFDDAVSGLTPLIDEQKATEAALAFNEAVAKVMAENQVTLDVAIRAVAADRAADISQDAAGRTALASGAIKIEDLIPSAAIETARTQAEAVGAAIPEGLISGATSDDALGRIGAATTQVADTAIAGARGRLQISSPSKVFVSIGRNISAGMSIGILTGKSAVINAAIAVASAAIKAAEDTLDSHSPSMEMFRIGAFMSEGLALGITSGTGRVMSAVTDLARLAAPGLPGLLPFGATTIPAPPSAARTAGGGTGGFTQADLITVGKAIAENVKPEVTMHNTFPEAQDSRATAADLAWRYAAI